MEGTKPPWWAPLVAQLVKNLPAMRETWFDLWVGKTPWRRERLPTPVFWPEEFHGLCSPWDHKESDTTEWLSLSLSEFYTAFTCLPTSWFAVKMLLFLLRRSSFPSFLLTFGLPSGSDGKKICLQCWRSRFDPWVRKIIWRRKWQPTPIFLAGESHEQRSLAGYSPWGRKELGHDWATNTFTFLTFICPSHLYRSLIHRLAQKRRY